MSEVATSVLHNVGNVLNSVNVSSSTISEKIRNSKVPNIAKAVSLMRAHESDLAVFLANDPKGNLIASNGMGGLKTTTRLVPRWSAITSSEATAAMA